MATDKFMEREIFRRLPNSLKHFQQLIMDAEACAKAQGKRTIFGGDKFEAKLTTFKKTVVACTQGLRRDRVVGNDATRLDVLSAIDSIMKDLESTYSSWPIAFDFWRLFYSRETGTEAPEPKNRSTYEFDEIVRQLKLQNIAMQDAVGHGINIAYSIFLQNFSDETAFMLAPEHEQLRFVQMLTANETELRDERRDYSTALGFSLFKAWIGAMALGDDEIEKSFRKELCIFSRIASQP